MSNGPLAGYTVLVVEDEPLLALDICDSLQSAGASIVNASTLSVGLELAGHPGLSVAVLDFGLSDGEGTAICERLKQRGVPFVLHSGYDHVEACSGGIVLPKPATPEQLLAAVMRALGAAQTCNLAHMQSGSASSRVRDVPGT
jgi:DNA-binding response OmpR family regulator